MNRMRSPRIGQIAGSRISRRRHQSARPDEDGRGEPAHLIDITRVPLNHIEEHEGGVRIGAMVAQQRRRRIIRSIRERYPVLSQALLAGASPQLRNMATMGGNLMQRTRCYYFYDPSYRECNKRNPGSGCAAMQGVNRIHAILGASEQCIATHPSDMCVALAALEAVVQVRGPQGERSIPIADFHRLPGDTPQLDTNLQPGELITAIDLPANRFARALALPESARPQLLRVRAGLGGGRCSTWTAAARFAMRASRWAASPTSPGAFRSGAVRWSGKHAGRRDFRAELRKRCVRGAKPYRDNAFKVELARRSVVRALDATAAA